MTTIAEYTLIGLKEILSTESDSVGFVKTEEGIYYFDIVQSECEFLAKCTPYYSTEPYSNNEIKGYEFEYQEKGQDFFKGSGHAQIGDIMIAYNETLPLEEEGEDYTKSLQQSFSQLESKITRLREVQVQYKIEQGCNDYTYEQGYYTIEDKIDLIENLMDEIETIIDKSKSL